MKRTHVFTAEDGKQYQDSVDCKAHEDSLLFGRLYGLGESEIVDAIANPTSARADAFERVGNMIGEKRRAMGELKRRKKKLAVDEKASHDT